MPDLGLDYNYMQQTQGWTSSEDDTRPFPPGIYTVEITKADLVTNQKGNRYLKIEYCVADGEFAGYHAYDNLYIYGGVGNDPEKVKRIAYQKLYSIAESIGISNPRQINRTEELFGQYLQIKTKIREWVGSDNVKHEGVDVAKYMPLTEAQQQQMLSQPGYAPQQTPPQYAPQPAPQQFAQPAPMPQYTQQPAPQPAPQPQMAPPPQYAPTQPAPAAPAAPQQFPWADGR